jgi:hypothetical protein
MTGARCSAQSSIPARAAAFRTAEAPGRIGTDMRCPASSRWAALRLFPAWSPSPILYQCCLQKPANPDGRREVETERNPTA